MKELFSILKRFVPPYKKYLYLTFFFNILSAILNLFAFAFIIPILEILFKMKQEVYVYIPFDTVQFTFSSFKDSLDHYSETLVNNFYYYIVDFTTRYGGGTTLLFLGLVLIVMTLLKTGTYYLATYFLVPIRTGVVCDIRNQVYNKIIKLPIGFFTEEKKGDIIARMSGDVQEIENSIMSSLDMLFKNPILILIYLIAMIGISWQLTIFVAILLPIAGFFMGIIGRKLKARSLLGQSQWSELLSQLEETLGGLRVVKAFNAEKKMSKRFMKKNDTFRRTVNRINRRQLLAHPLTEFLATATIVIVLWYGGSLILSNQSSITASMFIYYLLLFYSIINPAKDLSRASYAIQKGFASMDRVDKILMAEDKIVEAEHPVSLTTFQKEIEFRNVWFKYQNEWVLKNINLIIPKGKTVALVGQSGSGKSTLVDLIPRFYDVFEGEILIDGINIKEVRLKELRALMGNVNQDAILFNDSFYGNISFGVDQTSQEKVEEAARIANAQEFIESTEDKYESTVGDRGCKLSGGQRQRVSIARAILKNPPILILDEATSALDTESERMVQEALENLMKSRTTIAIAHRLSTIRNADEICVLHEGEIVERGKHDDLIELDGYYKHLSDMQTF
ncbi:MAG: ABC transporter ATP-binding protein [Bacteroidales bacterium]|jgi:ATP-binding cassette, subfamily B, bacterial MsbA|nr:ABC transporter ATP-binding protein [Bacteroidales bacterium]